MERATRCVTVLWGGAYLAPCRWWSLLGNSPWILLPLATLPLAAAVLRAVFVRDRAGLVPMTPRMPMVSSAYAALLGVGLALG